MKMPAKDQKIELNLEQLKAMVRIQCTAEECAAVLGMSVDTLDRRLKELEFAGFADFHKKYSHEGLASLRRAQWKSATQGENVTMQIWLGKQMLGQADKTENRNINVHTDASDLTEEELAAIASGSGKRAADETDRPAKPPIVH